MPRVVTGHQPTYLPWAGLLHKISLADVFVFMDDVQYLAQDWNNRNRIRTPQGWQWLTVPVRLKESPSLQLRDVRIDTSRRGTRDDWQVKHWKALELNYRRAPYFDRYASWLYELYHGRTWDNLAALNEHVLRYLLAELGLAVEFVRGSDCGFTEKKGELVLAHCRRFSAELCVTGEQGAKYIDAAAFAAAGVRVWHQQYRPQPYPQVWGEFIPALTVFDLLCQCGPESRRVICEGNLTRAQLEELAA